MIQPRKRFFSIAGSTITPPCSQGPRPFLMVALTAERRRTPGEEKAVQVGAGGGAGVGAATGAGVGSSATGGGGAAVAHASRGTRSSAPLTASPPAGRR